MPVLPKQADEMDSVWTSMQSPSSAWNTNGRRPEDTNATSAGTDDGGATAYCCLPSGCPNLLSDPICLNDLGDAVKVTGYHCDYY